MLRLPEVREIGDGCQNILIIRIHTDEGIVGIGEAHTNPLVSRRRSSTRRCARSRRSGLQAPADRRGPARHQPALRQDVPRHPDLRPPRRARCTCSAASTSRSGTSWARSRASRSTGCSAAPPQDRDCGLCQRPHARQPRRRSSSRDEHHVATGYRAIKFGWGGLGGEPARQDVRVAGAMPQGASGDDMDIMIDMGFAGAARPTPSISAGRSPSTACTSSRSRSRPTTCEASPSSTAVSPTPIATGEKETTHYALYRPDGARRPAHHPARRGAGRRHLRDAADRARMPRRAACASSRIAGRPTSWSRRRCTCIAMPCATAAYLEEYNVTDNPAAHRLLTREPHAGPKDGLVRSAATGPASASSSIRRPSPSFASTAEEPAGG